MNVLTHPQKKPNIDVNDIFLDFFIFLFGHKDTPWLGVIVKQYEQKYKGFHHNASDYIL